MIARFQVESKNFNTTFDISSRSRLRNPFIRKRLGAELGKSQKCSKQSIAWATYEQHSNNTLHLVFTLECTANVENLETIVDCNFGSEIQSRVKINRQEDLDSRKTQTFT